MANIDLGNLTRYDGKIKQYAENKYLSKNTANWQMTEKAGAVTCYPVPDTELEPIVDFSFKEVPPAEGEKSPTNPSTIEGVSNIKVTRCGENLFNVFGEFVPTVAYSLPDADSDGFISISGTPNPSADASRTRCVVKSDAILSDSTYTVVIEAESFVNCYLKFEYGQNLGSVRGQLNTGRVDVSTSGIHFITCTNNNQYNPNCVLRLVLVIPKANPSYSAKFRVSVFNGIVTSNSYVYIPYSDTNVIINFGDTYYGGSVNLATGLMTVTWGSKILNGTESFAKNTNYSTDALSNFSGTFSIPQNAMSKDVNVQSRFCSHFNYQTSTQIGGFTTWGNSTQVFFGMDNTLYPTKESFATWLADQYSNGTPVTLCYKLNNPYVVQLDPVQIKSLTALDKNTLRLNTLYTDANSIQVGYQKHPARTAYELENAILALGGGE